MDQFLRLIGEAVFHMGIPVGICWSVVRKMGGTPILGIILGLTLVSGQLLNAYAVATPIWCIRRRGQGRHAAAHFQPRED